MNDRIEVRLRRMKGRRAFQLRWIDPATGKRRTQSARTADPARAERARAELEYELNHGLHREAARMSWPRFRQLFEEEYLPGLRPETRLNHAKAMNLLEAICAPATLAGIGCRTLSQFVAGMRRRPGRGEAGKNGMQPSTIRSMLAFLGTALRWAAAQKFIPLAPALPEVKVPRRKPQPVPAELFERLLAAAGGDPHLRALLLSGWLAGLRVGEARRLEWDPSEEAPWVDLGSDRIRFPADAVKGCEDQWVPLDPRLREALEALPREGPRVFPWLGADGRPMSRCGVSYKVRRLARKAGVRLSMRSLRRGFGCHYAARVPAQILQKLMRHSDIKITMAYYANVDDAVMAAVLGPATRAAGNSPGNTPSPTPSERL